MGHGKETPRQKMIGMMYLVLTALLALNVAKSVLDAFINVDDGLQSTIKNYSVKNQYIYADFASQAALNEKKAGKLNNIALEIKKEADEIFNFINTDCKLVIVKKAEGEDSPAIHGKGDNLTINMSEILSKDDANIPSEIMWGTNENNGQGKILKEKLDKFREFCLSNIDPEDSTVIKSINRSLNTKVSHSAHGKHKHGGEERGDKSALWVSTNFEHLPLAGVITILSSIQTNIRNAESDMLMYLYNKVSASDMKFNKIDAITIPNSNYIIKGNDYTADIFIAASDSTQKPIIYVSEKKFYEETTDKLGNSVLEIKGELKKDFDTIPVIGGIGKYKRSDRSTGKKVYYGIIQITNLSDGSKLRRSFENTYQVAQANLVVSPTKMNVFYLGVDNPVKVSVPGVAGNKIKPTINNGSMTKTRAGYIVRPRKIGKAVVTVYAKIDDKDRKRMGSVDFRVKDIPPPVAKVGGKKGGTIQKSTLQVQRYVVAEMENFDFELKVNVTQFTVSASIGGFLQEITANSNKISDAQSALIKKVGRNQRIYFQDIKAKTPAGIKDLSTITFKVQ